MCSFLGYLGRWTTFINLFFSPAPHHVLGPRLSRYCNKYVRKINFYVQKNLPSTNSNEKFANYSTSTSRWTCSSFFVTLLSTYFFSSKSLIMINAGVDTIICLQRCFKVPSSPFPTMAIHFNDSKISCSTYLPSLKLSLLSQNAKGGLDASGSMYIATVVLKSSSLFLYNSLFLFSILPPFYLLSLN